MSDIARSAAAVPASYVTVIRPRPDAHGKVVKLSAIDQIAPRDYISLCLFFKLPRDADKKRIFRTLELALVNTVSGIPELACCVQKHAGNDREEVELLFDSTKGVEIHYKDYTLPETRGLWKLGTFDQLEQEHFPLNKMPRSSIFGTSAKLVGSVKLPALVVQATFIPGGLILGSCLHIVLLHVKDGAALTSLQHVAGDGICNYLWHTIMGAHFAAISKGLSGEAPRPIPDLARSDAVKGDQGVTLEELPDWKLAGDTTSFLNPTVYEASEAQAFEYATYFITAEKLASLKKHISNGAPEVKFGTTEILSAFLWRHVVLARGIDPQRYPEAKLSITIDARGRMESPEVPSNFWGNFAEPNAVARLPVASLKRPCSSLPLEIRQDNIYPEAARQIKSAITAVNDKAVRRLVGLLNQMPKSTALTWNVDRYPGPDMLIVCIQAHRFNDIYFGPEVGYPSAMRFTIGDTEGKLDGRCSIMPPRRADGKGLEVALQYDSSTLKRLEDNPEFNHFFVRRN